MLTKKEFEKLKSDLLRCSPQQMQQAQAVLTSLSTGTQAVARTSVEDLYAALQDSTSTAARISFASMRKLSPGVIPKLELLHKILEQYLDREFSGCSKQERTAVRNLLIDAARDYVPAGVGRLGHLISVLSVPEQVMEEAFPGYCDVGVLRECLLHHVRMGASYVGN